MMLVVVILLAVALLLLVSLVLGVRQKGASELFSLGLEHQADLNNKNMTRQLRQEFRNNGVRFSRNVTVSIRTKDNEWRVDDKGNNQNYIVRKENGKLNVYSLKKYAPDWAKVLGKLLAPLAPEELKELLD
jgi:hypothetical protein